MIYTKDEFGNDIREYEIGDTFYHDGSIVEIVEIDMDIKVKSHAEEYWLKESQVDELTIYDK